MSTSPLSTLSRTPSPPASFSQQLPSKPTSIKDPDTAEMPYNLARYATYPRSTAPPDSLASFAGNIRDASISSRAPLEAPVHSGSSSGQESLQSIASRALVQVTHHTSKPLAPSSPCWLSDVEMVTASQIQLDPAFSATRSTSSSSSFKTADEDTIDQTQNNHQGYTDSDIGDVMMSENSLPPSGVVLHSDPDDYEPIDIYAPPCMQVSPPIDDSSGTLVGLYFGEEPTNVGVIDSYTVTRPSNSSTVPIVHLEPFPPPKIPPKPAAYSSTYKVLQEQQQLHPPKLPPRPKQPIMLLFQILGTKNNYEIRKCEYTIRYKSSEGNSSFPSCPAKDSIFLFDDLCKIKGVIERMRLWHRMNPFKPKDMRVDEMQYRMSYQELVELRDWKWPGYIGKEWARCLIWPEDEDGLKKMNEN
ncbi:hypothetical protein ABW20_dc0109040 [Dactylellina cionopaga]|nr:hypothetical protein ABW20_dc0109040 [Dactylellina cionopaga]